MDVKQYFVTPRSEKWHALRKTCLTASELGAAAGLDKYGTPYSVWAIKADLATDDIEDAVMKRGRWLESAVCSALQEVHPEYQIEYPLNLFLDAPEVGLGGTPDALGHDAESKRVVFEFKVVSKQVYEESWGDGPPISHQLQTLSNAMLLDADYGILAALIMGYRDVELVVIRIDRDPAAEAAIVDLAKRFWEAFDEGHALVPPDYARDGDIIRQIYQPDPDLPAPLDLSADNRFGVVLDRFAEVKAALKAHGEEKEALEAEIIEKLGGSTAAIAPGWKVSYKLQTRKGYVVKDGEFPVLRPTRVKS